MYSFPLTRSFPNVLPLSGILYLYTDPILLYTLLYLSRWVLTSSWRPVSVNPHFPTTWQRRKSQTRWTCGADPPSASPACCWKCVASGPSNTYQTSWSSLPSSRQQGSEWVYSRQQCFSTPVHWVWRGECAPGLCFNQDLDIYFKSVCCFLLVAKPPRFMVSTVCNL